MTTEPDPTLDDVPLESAVQAEAARPPFDQRTQLACGSGFAVAIIGLLGSLVGAWTFDFAGVILIVAGLLAFGTAYVSFGRETFRPTVARRDLILGGAPSAPRSASCSWPRSWPTWTTWTPTAASSD